MLLDASLTMEVQLTNVIRLAFFQLCQIRKLAPDLSRPDLVTVIHATVTRLDYRNSLHAGLPLKLTWKIAAVLECSGPCPYRNPTQPMLCQLH